MTARVTTMGALSGLDRGKRLRFDNDREGVLEAVCHDKWGTSVTLADDPMRLSRRSTDAVTVFDEEEA